MGGSAPSLDNAHESEARSEDSSRSKHCVNGNEAGVMGVFRRVGSGRAVDKSRARWGIIDPRPGVLYILSRACSHGLMEETAAKEPATRFSQQHLVSQDAQNSNSSNDLIHSGVGM